MNFLEHTLIWDWCRRHRIALDGDEPGSRGPIRLADDPTLDLRGRALYTDGKGFGRVPAIAASAMRALGAWDECLVWVTDWDVRTCDENWPRFYAWRAAHGEKRSLASAPGHLFRADEAAELEEMLTRMMEDGWDATVLPARDGVGSDRRLIISHDEWIAIRSRTAVEFIEF